MLLVLSLAVISCSQDPIPEAEIREGRVYNFTITQQTDPNATENEGIRTLTLVFTGANDRIVAVEEINQTDFVGTTTDPVLQGTVTLKVTEEATAVYAFANLDSENLTNHTDIQGALKVGKTFNKGAIAKIAGINELVVSTDRAIPMSSHSYVIPETGGTEENPEEIGPIVLYRMIAKVEVTLKNNTDADVTINSLSLGNFQYRDIYLLPYAGLEDGINENNKENVRPNFPEGTSTTYTTYSLPIVSTATSINAGLSMEDYKHYIHETDLGESDRIKVSAQIVGKDVTPVNTRFSFVRRNDYLRIPLVFDKNQLVITLEESYAPIGGYPFKNILDGTEITVHEGAVVQLKVEVKDAAGNSVSATSLALTHKSGDLLLYPGETGETGTYIAQVPAQPTTATSTYTLKADLGGSEYTQDLIFKVTELDADALTSKSAPRSAGASLVLKEFYQLSCQTDE